MNLVLFVQSGSAGPSPPRPSPLSCPSLQFRTLTHHLPCVFPPCLSSFSYCSSIHTMQTWYWRIELAVLVISSLSQGFRQTHHTLSDYVCVYVTGKGQLILSNTLRREGLHPFWPSHTDVNLPLKHVIKMSTWVAYGQMLNKSQFISLKLRLSAQLPFTECFPVSEMA